MSQVFLGDFTHSIDKQRRVAIPRDWREGDSHPVFFVLPGRDKSIKVLPEDLFMEEVYQKARKVSFANAEKSQALAELGRNAQKAICDKQGRISLPEDLMIYAGLETSSMAQLTGGITMISIRKPAEEEEKLDERINNFLDQMESIHESGEI